MQDAVLPLKAESGKPHIDRAVLAFAGGHAGDLGGNLPAAHGGPACGDQRPLRPVGPGLTPNWPTGRPGQLCMP